MVDDEPVAGALSVGQQLRAAREAKGLSIEDVASSTRIPTRHLQSLEDSEWHKLPAATYSIGFAKNYAGAIGLDKSEIAEQLRAEMGSELPAHYTTVAPENLEPLGGNRSMPTGIVIGAILALIIVVAALSWLSNRDLQGDEASAEAPIENVDTAVTPAAATATGAVLITANDAVWIQVRDGATILTQGELAAGQSFEVPASAAAPVLMTGKPEALRISVGTGDAPPIGPAGVRVSGVSLLGPDLLRGPNAAAPSPAALAPIPPAGRASEPRRVATSPPPQRTAPLPTPNVAPATTPLPEATTNGN